MPAASLTALKHALASRIATAVGAMSLTQAEAAQALQITQPRLNALLKGRVELFSLDALAEIAQRAGLTVRISATRRYRIAE